ncbi:MAG: beta-ketoacyl-ACP synthase II [Candidatus Dormibacteraeota bacterium]|uniref:3-oxoacyl-[acyl-carrier-protein] synthase 2 n=1 Tax=Candidatus Dormiibacter inghamiae TaxID=3127013 RepID=A0A934KIE7_9BACT|nr:beta-ketoacyl-ACP synthase II [Candidatus Dormibacteraeota bacterium]MBJ7605728.1 beta-ketoacyl-ACP synthase II [Candidatus Dormibacteraeota bacterium]
MSKNGERRVVVTGLGTINPLGHNVDEYWSGLIAGRSGVAPMQGIDTARLATKFAAQVKDFDPVTQLDRKVAQRTARFTQFALVAAGQALEDAALQEPEAEKSFRIGVELGTGIGGFEVMTADAHRFLGTGRMNPLYATMVIPNIAAAQVAMHFKLRGPNATVVTACAAATHALGNAYRIIQRGDADVMLAGGTEASLCEVGIASFNAIRALSTRNDDPERASRPFDRDRDGFVPAEGAGALVLEDWEHACARDARIYGEVAGFGVTNDAFHQVAPDESGAAPAHCIKIALADADIAPEDVDYVNAHGTSTSLNDAAETRALKMALGDHARRVPISSTKSMIGHLLGAAGAVEAIAVLKTINEGVIHPTINLHQPDPECDLDYVPNQARPGQVRIALSNSFGFGGQNCTLVLKRYEE